MPEGGGGDALVGQGEQRVQRVQILHEADEVSAQRLQHLVVAVTQTVRQEMVAEHPTHVIGWQICTRHRSFPSLSVGG